MKRFLKALLPLLFAVTLPAQTIVVPLGNAKLTTALNANSQTVNQAATINFGATNDTTLARTGAGALTLTGALTTTGALTVNGAGDSLFTGFIGVNTLDAVVPLHAETSGVGTTAFSNVVGTLRAKAAGRDVSLQFSDGTNQAYISSLSGALKFGTGGATERMSLSATGNLTASGTGNHVFGTTNTVTLNGAQGRVTLTPSNSGTAKGYFTNDSARADVFQFGSNFNSASQDDVGKPSWVLSLDSRVAGDEFQVQRAPAGGAATAKLRVTNSGTIVTDNLTVSGTGTHSFAGQVSSIVNASSTTNLGSFVAANSTLNGFTSYSPGASLDQKYWMWQAGSAVADGAFRLRALNDVQNNGINALSFIRSGIASVMAIIGGSTKVSGDLTVSGTTASTSTTTGAAVVSGGLGLAGNLVQGGYHRFLSNAVLPGQGSISKDATFGLNMYAATGSSNDFTIFNGAGAVLLANPTGTANLTMNGNLTVSGTGTHTFAGQVQLPNGSAAAPSTRWAGGATTGFYNYDDGAVSGIGMSLGGVYKARLSSTGLEVVNNLTVSGTGTHLLGGTGTFWASGNTIGFDYATNGTSTGYINYYGYGASSTQFRNLIISDGKTAPIATFTGSDKSLVLAGYAGSNTTTAFPGALAATGSRFYANSVGGATIYGYGSSYDFTLANRAGTMVANVGASGTTLAIVGTATNDNAATGYVGEYVSSSRPWGGSALSLTTSTGADVTSISLTAGDWDVEGSVAFAVGATTTVTGLVAAVSSTSASTGTAGDGRSAIHVFNNATIAMNLPPVVVTPRARFSLSATTTIYLTTYAQFGVSTIAASGTICARRVR